VKGGGPRAQGQRRVGLAKPAEDRVGCSPRSPTPVSRFTPLPSPMHSASLRHAPRSPLTVLLNKGLEKRQWGETRRPPTRLSSKCEVHPRAIKRPAGSGKAPGFGRRGVDPAARFWPGPKLRDGSTRGKEPLSRGYVPGARLLHPRFLPLHGTRLRFVLTPWKNAPVCAGRTAGSTTKVLRDARVRDDSPLGRDMGYNALARLTGDP
jgi:hypothetical protein